MKLPKIKKATWEKEHYPKAKYVVTESKYNTYYPCPSIREAIRLWLWLFGLPFFGKITRSK